MVKDEIVEEVRKAREAQGVRWRFGIKAILADARKRQGISKRKVVSFVEKNSRRG